MLFLRRRCRHQGRVIYDLTEGERRPPIKWCTDCGAIDRSGAGEWEVATD